jgi:hypothetical protein
MFNYCSVGKTVRIDAGVHGKILRISFQSARIDKPNSEGQLTGQSRQLMFEADSLLV